MAKRKERSFDDDDMEAAEQGRRRGAKRGGTQGQVAFRTKAGKQVVFRTSGARAAKRNEKLLDGKLRCVVNPATGRAVKEGTPLYRKLRRQGVRAAGDCVVNPVSGMAVRATSKLGKHLIKTGMATPHGRKVGPKSKKYAGVRREIAEARGDAKFTEI